MLIVKTPNTMHSKAIHSLTVIAIASAFVFPNDSTALTVSGDLIVTGKVRQDTNTTSGSRSAAFGQNNNASAGRTLVFGYDNTASGWDSFAGGKFTEATGQFSATLGYETKATGDGSFSTGIGSEASGHYAFAIGNYTDATGWYAVSIGKYTLASGNLSFAAGDSTVASGRNAFSGGAFTQAESYASFAIGQYNEGGYSTSNNGDTDWVSSDPVFEIGIGSDNNNRENAITVLKNGNMGIGDSAPGEKLVVANGNIKVTGTGKIILENHTGDIPMGAFQ